MQRLRISELQVAILRLIGEEEGGCVPSSPAFKMRLYGRRTCASTSERVTLNRSVRRLVANGMISDNGRGGYRLTDKGRDWLAARDGAHQGPPRWQVNRRSAPPPPGPPAPPSRSAPARRRSGPAPGRRRGSGAS